jgi:(S)-sulfolactate dehydrogenase
MRTMADIVISEFMDEAAIRASFAAANVLYDPALVDKPAELVAALADARALIVRNRTKVTAQLLAAGPKLQAVGRLGVGLDNIDLSACKAANVAVYPATGANDASVAEYVIGSLLLLMRGAYAATDEVIAGAWPRTKLMGHEIGGKQLGLVGFGGTARETARRAAALDMTICAYDPYLPDDAPAWKQPFPVRRMDLATLLAQSDAVSLHVPATAETAGLIGRDALASMKPGAILVNAARGGVVDEAALAEALRAGRLGGAAIDVFAQEPVSAAYGAVFAGCPRLILTPHIAGVSIESNIRVSNLIAEKIRAHLSGDRK